MTRVLEGLDRVLERVKKVYLELPLQQLDVVIKVAKQEGITMPELRELTGMSQGSVSRNVKELSVYLVQEETEGQKKVGATRKGYGLIEKRPDLYNPHRLALFLTPAGKKLIEEFEDSFKS